MTLKLYYTDPYQFEFDAKIISSVQDKEIYKILLDQTGFFPGGGGQPQDTGWLNKIPVTDLKIQDGKIYHFTQMPIVGERVFGRIDLDRRYDYMQQHTGQHILSQALLKIGNYQTVSVHFGENYTAVEINHSDITSDKIIKVEDLANSIINQNLSIKTHWISSAEVKKFNIRKPSPVVGKIRIIEIENFDFSACGGIHLSRTGEVGLIKLIGQEKLRGNPRLLAKIGKRALYDYESKINLVKMLQNTLTCGENDIPGRVTDLLEQNRENQKKLSKLQNQLILSEVAEALSSASVLGEYKFVQKIFNKVDNNVVRSFANEASNRKGVVTAVFNINNNSLFWLVNQSIGDKINLQKIVEPIIYLIDGKGGGNLHLMQGGGKNIEGISEFIKQLKEKLDRSVSNE
jgi:alanyl-tRNA synthetase